MAYIIVAGDSIAYGAWDLAGGWVQRLRTAADKKNVKDFDNICFVYNLGVSDETSERLLKRFKTEVKPRLYWQMRNEKAIIIIGIGKNDSAYSFYYKCNWVSPKKFESNIRKLITIAKKFTPRIAFVGLSPVDESKSNPFDKNVAYRNKSILQYNGIMKQVCEENKIHFFDVHSSFMKANYKTLLEDGVHPNAKGHQKIFELVKAYLIKTKIL
jgi:lysophospholipase L1-like esterase